jgi:formylglycine-generating enzyme required for sulfatase activity
VLGLLGLDERHGIGLDANGLPRLDWVAVPGGKVRLEDEGGTHDVKAFHIARYPVTQTQFGAFIKADDGFKNPQWWDREWLEQGWSDPEKTPKAHWAVPNRPMDSVSWYDAVAFCRWLTARMGFEVRLPMEMEWQQAASGGDPENRYPWGGKYRSGYANINEKLKNAGPYNIGETSPVGLYPKGASVQGALDLSGNVWGWCLNKHDDPADLSLGGGDRRSVHAGSWIDYRDTARTAGRYSATPDFGGNLMGFRVCCVFPINRH